MPRRFAGAAGMRRTTRAVGRDGSRGGSGGAPIGSGVPLPASAVEYWHSELGISLVGGKVDSWKGQIRGIVVPFTSQRPDYAPDGANFNARPAVQNGYLQASSLSQIVAAGSRPYTFSVYRIWTLPTSDSQSSIIDFGVAGVSDDHDIRIDRISGANVMVYASGSMAGSSPLGIDTNPHMLEAWADGALGHIRIDGVDVSGAYTGSISHAPTAIGISLAASGVYHPLVASHVFHLLCSAKPSEAEIATLRAWAISYFNLPQTPATILGALLHADFSASDPGLVQSAGKVSSIPNRGVDTAAMIQNTAAAQPTYSATSFNGLPGLTFDGVDDTMLCTFTTPIPIGRRPYMWVVFQQLDTVAADQIAASMYYDPSGVGLWLVAWGGRSGAPSKISAGMNTGGGSAATALLVNSDLNRHLIEVADTVNGVAGVVLDGVATDLTNGSTLCIPIANPVTQLRMAAFDKTPSQFGHCVIARVIVANDMPSQAQRDAVRAYLQTTYGI